VMIDIMFDLPDRPDVKEYLITPEVVEKGAGALALPPAPEPRASEPEKAQPPARAQAEQPRRESA